MAPSNSHQFYSELPLPKVSITDLVAQEQYFKPVPADWHVVITDIKSSTQAVKDGLHQIINLVATGSIIAAINLARNVNITIPFFFGGDGATLLIPDNLLDPVMKALYEHQENTSRNFGLTLRVGHVPVADVYKNNYQFYLVLQFVY